MDNTSSINPCPATTPGVDDIKRARRRIDPYIVHTPTVPWIELPEALCPLESLHIKLELLQRTGSFKPRGAVNTVLQTPDVGRGITAFSAGNHAIAAAYAARCKGVPARVAMPRSANPLRVARCRAQGAEIVFGESIDELLDIVGTLSADGWVMIHPFEGEHTVTGTATVGLELARDLNDIDVVLVPLGGGGLIAGVASAIKQLQPSCRVIGVEPEGARGMADSLAAGQALASVSVSTIADSLGAPLHLPYTFSLIQQHVDELVQVSDAQMREAMRLFLENMKLAVEPACAATLAALLHPLAGQFESARVAMIGCGSNIDAATYRRLLEDTPVEGTE